MAGDDAKQSNSRQIDPVAVDALYRRRVRQSEPPWLHREIARRMAERLPVIKLQPKTLVDWGGSAGASDEFLAATYPKARRIIVEPTAELADKAREAHKPAWWSASRWSGPAVDVVTSSQLQDQSAELLWSNMALHAAIDPPAVLLQWQRTLVVGGFVMYSCFGPDTVRELRALYRALGWPAPTIDFVDMHDLGDMMVHAGFADPVMDQESLTLTWDSPQALLAELRTLGSNASPARFDGLRGKAWLARLEDALRRKAGADGRIAMTFEISYGHAFKAQSRVRGATETSVSLDEMRAMVRGGAQATRQR
jgi:malonyl-CoA O-methyltransferase